MPLFAPRPKYVTPLEEDEWYQAKIISVEKLENVETMFGVKDQLEIKLTVDGVKDDAGNPVELRTSPTLSLHKKATLLAFVKGIEGKEPDDLDSYDLETLVGRKCRVMIEHNEKNGRGYANITKFSQPKGDTGKKDAKKLAEKELGAKEVDPFEEDLGPF